MVKLTAEVEFERLQNSVAWSPLTQPAAVMKNQSCARYTFADGSRLYIYFNGSASCERHAANVISFKESWHNLTK